MTQVRTALEVFCSYAQVETALFEQLQRHLSVLQKQQLISLWHPHQIEAGLPITPEIQAHLNGASVILLLMSADFLASDQQYSVEMERALERHRANEARVVPILLRSVDIAGTPFAALKPLPSNGTPITSWTNQDEAFADVVAGLRRVIEDLSFFPASASRAEFPPVWSVPYPRNAFFTGREEILADLHTHSQSGQTQALTQPQAVSGLGGIGKTQVAIEYAYRYRHDYQYVLWARAETAETLTASYVDIAQQLQLPQKDEQKQQAIIQAVKHWLHTHGEWLLILDNADTLSLAREFLPPILGGHLLLTTRAQAMGWLARRREIDTLFSQQAALFLLHRSALVAPDLSLDQVLDSERTLAIEIARELGELPLALDQAGAYIEETGCSLSEYLQRYRRYRIRLLEERRGLVEDHPEFVTTTWTLSFERVEAKNPAAVDLLRLCAFLAPDAIGDEIFIRGVEHLGPTLAPVAADDLLRDQAMEVLRTYSLISPDPQTHTIALHRLVQMVLHDGMDATIQTYWLQCATKAVAAALSSVDHPFWSQWECLVPQVQRCAQPWEQQKQKEEMSLMFQKTGSYLRDRGRYEEAQPLLERAYQMSITQKGTESLEVARDGNTLAPLYQNQGKYEEAEPLYKRALELYEQHYGSQHPATALGLNNLAGLY